MRTLLIFAILAPLAVWACSPREAIRDKVYYALHPEERSAEIGSCGKNTGAIGSSPNCLNAKASAADAESARFWAIKRPKSRLTSPGAL